MDDISVFYFENMLLPSVARFAITPQSGFQDSFLDITEEGLIEAISHSIACRDYLKEIYGLTGAKVTWTQLRDAAVFQKGVLMTKTMFGGKKGYRAMVGVLASFPSTTKRYLLTGTFRTNGQSLQVMAFDRKKQLKQGSDGEL
jgi:hypothetical protein